ncbi:hypothetical protein EGH62_05440 [Klebsiella aerogenes]|nr:hypothetical protein EGH62_05440 [Klebsiella aerogenes]
MFSESGFTHSDLLRGHNQYVGRSLKVNGPFCRDTYSYTAPACGFWIIKIFQFHFSTNQTAKTH